MPLISTSAALFRDWPQRSDCSRGVQGPELQAGRSRRYETPDPDGIDISPHLHQNTATMRTTIKTKTTI
jgi:hypothetical protein